MTAPYCAAATNCEEYRQSPWTIERAAQEVAEWHNRLASADSEQRFLLLHGRPWDRPIDYTPFPNETLIGDYRFVALRSSKDLFEEGSLMHHCVASYSGAVLNGSSRIFSIRHEQTAKHLATLEMNPASREPGWVPVQIKGPFNAKPVAGVAEACAYFTVIANGGKPDVEREVYFLTKGRRAA